MTAVVSTATVCCRTGPRKYAVSRQTAKFQYELDWASRSLQREFEEVIMVDVLIEEMVRSD